jgi:hypothetical protein
MEAGLEPVGGISGDVGKTKATRGNAKAVSCMPFCLERKVRRAVKGQQVGIHRPIFHIINTAIPMDFFNVIRQGELEILKASLKEDPALLETKDPRGFTPLILATYSGKQEIARYLIECGADVNARDAAGNTALMGICFKGETQLAHLLLAHGADVNLQNFNGATALIFAATFGHAEIARLLLDAGADKSVTDSRGNTAMSHALHQGFAQILEMLN